MKKESVGSFDGSICSHVGFVCKAKQALGYDYVGGYNALHVFVHSANDMK